MLRMYKKSYVFAVSALLLTACERSGPSPVEIKVDQDFGSDTRAAYEEKGAAIISSAENLYGQPKEEVTSIPLDEFNEVEKGDELDSEFEKVIVNDSKSSSKSVSEPQRKQETKESAEEADFLSNPKIVKEEKAKPKTVVSKEKALVQAESSKLSYPVKGKIISNFGDDMGDGITNDGINIKAAEGTNVAASGNGTVIYAGDKLEEDFGNVVIIQHDGSADNVITSYAHLKNIKVKNNAKVKAGDIIGTVGKTGDVRSPQLHFEVMKNKKPVNPVKYLQK